MLFLLFYDQSKSDMRRSSSEVSVKSAQSPDSTDCSSITPIRKNQDDISVGDRSRKEVISVVRNRSSKSESDLKVLKMEDDTQGPITNWKNIGHLGKYGDQTVRSTG